MANFYDDNEDLQWYVDKGIDWEPLIDLTEYGYRSVDGFKVATEATEFYRDVLRTFGRFAGEEVAPRAPAIDRKGVEYRDGDVVFCRELDEIFAKAKEMELYGLTVPRELGGSNCPMMVYQIATELLARGDVSVMAHYAFHGALAMALLLYSINEGTTEFDRDRAQLVHTRWRREIEEIVAGDAWGAMDITEPDAGSDMARLRTKGEQDQDGNWFVTGQKMFITSGHGKYHIVIARTEAHAPDGDAFSGLRGLSLFLVPTYEVRPDGTKHWLAKVERIEEKLGHHGSPTCMVAFDGTPAQLIGHRGEGFKLMLLLMNNARIGVGFESIGLCEAAYRAAEAYAAQRPSMGKTIDRHEMIADYLDEMRVDILGLRALAMQCAYYEELTHKSKLAARMVLEEEGIEAKRLVRQAKEYAARARHATPLLKYLAAEKAVEMARRCVQIHGGVGYTKEFGAEKLLRDAMVMPIYEGTSQIQALMAMKDALQNVMRNPQEFVRRMAQARWRSLSALDPLERRLARLQGLELSARQHLIQKTATEKIRGLSGKPISKWRRELFRNWDPKRDFAHAQLHAERLTRLMADVAICEVLWEQSRRHPERRPILEAYLERAEPRCRFLLDEITGTRGDQLIARLRRLDQSDDAVAE